MKTKTDLFYIPTLLMALSAFIILFKGYETLAFILFLIDIVMAVIYSFLIIMNKTRNDSFFDYQKRKYIYQTDRIMTVNDITIYSEVMRIPMISEEGEAVCSLKVLCFDQDRDKIHEYLYPRLVLPISLEITSVPVISEYSLKGLKEAKAING